MSDEHIVKSHNRSLLLYHLVFPAKCRRKVFVPEVEETLRRVCLGIEECYEIRFVEIGMEADHVHFLVQGEDGLCERGLLPFPFFHSNKILCKYLLTPSSMEIKDCATKYSF